MQSDQPRETSFVAKLKANKKLVFSISFLIISILFFTVIAFVYGGNLNKSNNKAVNGMVGNVQDEYSTTSYPVSFIIEDPLPNTETEPTPTPNPTPTLEPLPAELTYKFPQAYGFEMTYTTANWEVVEEPIQVNEYDPASYSQVNNVLRLKTLKYTGEYEEYMEFTFRKALSQTIKESPTTRCSIDKAVLEEQTSVDAQDGFFVIELPGSEGRLYSRAYFTDPTDSGKKCAYTSHPIYAIEKVAGGENEDGTDSNDIYWTVNVRTYGGKRYMGADNQKITKSITFKGN